MYWEASGIHFLLISCSLLTFFIVWLAALTNEVSPLGNAMAIPPAVFGNFELKA